MFTTSYATKNRVERAPSGSAAQGQNLAEKLRFRGKMADDIDEPLAEGWEAVVDDTGRTYWWNTETNETTWTKPVAVLAKKGLAAGAAPA